MLDRLTAIPRNFFSTDGLRISFLGYAFLIMLCVGFFSPGLITMPPTDRDESSFAQASKQMIETGNYTDIRLQNEARYKKPIGIYWLQAAAVKLVNPDHLNEIWAYRIPSFIGATLAVLMTAALGALLFSPTTGLLAAIMMAGCVLLNVEARLAKTDAVLLACVMVMQYALASVYLKKASPWGTSFLFWTALAAGILIKGPIILLPLFATLIWIGLSDKSLSWIRVLHPVLGLFYALALIAPWFVAITLQSHGAFMEQSAGQDMLAKIWQGQNRGFMPPGMHFLALPIAFFPYALFVIFALPDMWKNRHDDAVKFCLGWIVPTWFVFEAASTKLPHYVLPVYPALALLSAKVLLDGFPAVANAKRRIPIALIIALWFMIGAGFMAAMSLLPDFVDRTWVPAQIVVGVLMVLMQGFCMIFLPKDKTASIACLTIGSLLFITVTFGTTIPKLNHMWMSRSIVEAIPPTGNCVDKTQVISLGYHEPSLVFLAGTNTLFPTNGADAAQLLMQDHCRIAAIDNDHKDEFLNAFAKNKIHPIEVASLDGFNSGHGGYVFMTIYKLP